MEATGNGYYCTNIEGHHQGHILCDRVCTVFPDGRNALHRIWNTGYSCPMGIR